jgi:hypothetical protein
MLRLHITAIFVQYERYMVQGTLYPQKLALTSSTSGGRSVGIVRSRTQATEFVFMVQSSSRNWANMAGVSRHNKSEVQCYPPQDGIVTGYGWTARIRYSATSRDFILIHSV